MEKENKYQAFQSQDQPIEKSDSHEGSIRTQSATSEKSSHSINMSPSRSSDRRRQLSPPGDNSKSTEESQEAVQSQAGFERQNSKVSSRQSPLKERHRSRKESQVSNHVDADLLQKDSKVTEMNPQSAHSKKPVEDDDDAFMPDDPEKGPEELNFNTNNNQSLPPSPVRRASTKQASPPASPSKRSSVATGVVDKPDSITASPRRKSSVVPPASPSKRGSVTTPSESKPGDSVNGSPRRRSSFVPPASPSKRGSVVTPVNQKTESTSGSPQRSIPSPQKSVKEERVDDTIATTPRGPSPLLETSRSDDGTKSKSTSHDSRSRSRSRSRSKSPSEKSDRRSPSHKSSSSSSSGSKSGSRRSSQGHLEVEESSRQATPEAETKPSSASRPQSHSSRKTSVADKEKSETHQSAEEQTDNKTESKDDNDSPRSKAGSAEKSEANDDTYSADFEDANIPPKEDDSYELPADERIDK